MSAIETRVINLARRADRLDAIGKKLDDLGIAWHRQEAVDAREYSAETLQKWVPGTSRAYPMTHVERACARSHILAWRAFLNGTGNALCVLEDDVDFGTDLAALLANDEWLTPEHGLIKLDANSTRMRKSLVSRSNLDNPLEEHELYRLFSRRLGGGGYVAHRETIMRLANAYQRPSAPIDHCLFNPPYSSHFVTPGVHIIEPTLVFHDHTGSDMEAARQDNLREGPTALVKFYREVVGAKAAFGRVAAIIGKGARFKTFK